MTVIFVRSWWPGQKARPSPPDEDVKGALYRPIFLDAPLFFEGSWLAWYLRRYLRQSPVDVIVSTGAEASCLCFLRKASARPHIASYHHPCAKWVGLGQLLSQAANLSRRGIATTYRLWDEYLGRQVLDHADQVVCSSIDQKDRVVRALRIPKLKVRVIYCGIDTRRLCPPDGSQNGRTKTILHAGGLSQSKGFEVLLEAFAQISKEFPEARVSVLGGGDWRPFQDRIDRLGLAGWVRNFGQIPHWEMVRHYQSAYVLAAPTRHESFGLVFAEAMACGVPVIATRVTANPEVVEHEVTGILVPPGDPSSLAQALVCLLRNPLQAFEMGRAGRARVLERFDWDKIIRQWERLLYDVARRGAV